MWIVGLNVGPNRKSHSKRPAKLLILLKPTAGLEPATY
jgi:hypothetical protein